MSEPIAGGGNNPFEQPYPPSATSSEPLPPNTTTTQPSSNNGSPSVSRAPPALVLPSDSAGAGASGDSSPPSRASLATAHPNQHGANGRRVQWPADLSTHVSIAMASPVSRTLTDEGGRDALTRALEAHSQSPTDAHPSRYIGPSGSEGPSRAASSDGEGEAEERMEELRQGMDVYVDPGERDGLPTLPGGRTVEERSSKAAWGLVRGVTSGGFGLRGRKNAGFKGGRGDNADEEAKEGAEKVKGSSDPEKEITGAGTGGGFFHNPFRPSADISSTSPPSSSHISGGAPSGGILSALIALQQQQQQQASNGGASGATSGATTPTSLAPSRGGGSTTAYSSADEGSDEEEELERLKFLKKQREKRSNRTAAQKVVEGVGGTAKGVGKGVFGAGAIAVGGAGKGLSSLGGGHSRAPSGDGTPQPQGGTKTPPMDKKKKSLFGEMKKASTKLALADVGDALDRPDAAKSGAGVFGGLMLSAGNIAGAAAPAATALGPNPERPGYHLSRYSAPTVPLASGPSSAAMSRAGSEDQAASQTLGGTPPGTPPNGQASLHGSGEKGKKKPGFALNLKELQPHTPKFGFHSRPPSSHDGSPKYELSSYFKETDEQRDQREWEKEKKRRRKIKEKKKAQEVFITMHVAAILERQQFIMKLARSFMMFGAPSHRLEAQMQATARVLEINCQVIYIPGVMLISFGDAATHTSEIKFLKQANGLDLGKLLAAYMVYYNVIYDKISVTDASVELDELMTAGPKYNLWQNMIIGGLASAFIQPSAFYGSFIDCLVAIPLGALLVLVQVVVSRNDLYSSLFEIVIACINAFLAAALASTKKFCFAAVASGSVVLILPGYIVLCGSLELANRSIISGSVRLVYSILYSLFLGFGLAMGSEVYQRITGLTIYGATDYTCSALRGDVPWYQQTIPPWFFFLTIPCYLLMLSLRNGQPFYRKETILMLLIGSAGFTGNYFSGRAFPGRSDIVSAIGSFIVGFLGNLYGKFTRGSPFVVMVAGVLLQLPSGLANGGLLQFAAENTDANTTTTSYSAGFSTATSLVEVAIGLTVGLFVSAAVVNALGGGRRRGTNLSSF